MAIFKLTRKRDWLYLIFFITHIPIMLVVDIVPLYPNFIKPAFLGTIRDYYINTYHDQFFINPPPWFKAFLWVEALYHIPFSAWAVIAILQDDPRLLLHCLVFGTVLVVTTSMCLVEMLSWTMVSGADKWNLATLYGPYLGFGIFMVIDMYRRLETGLPVIASGVSPNKRNKIQ